jgi:threonyl-tRNA synthetase
VGGNLFRNPPCDGLRAWGSRYNELTRPFFKSALPGVGAVIRITTDAREMVSPVKPGWQSAIRLRAYRRRSQARKHEDGRHPSQGAHPAHAEASASNHSRNRCATQKALNPPYLLIMGRKEALERSVILRHRASYTETFIPFDSLVESLREVS